ncbi:alpha-ketoglutarate-dependent dioxygenase AlkB [Gordonia shandongensis]|uniref:alpha-ketoglutarate-dependent dioxygenase AlkB n=1 Tax=Gordonia shandongensis TaxID=376351 RepID=UPI000429A59E|nr:alpha-ketoglutarate-dependent dioxygenase AlkB [Gordonia shandongensis]
MTAGVQASLFDETDACRTDQSTDVGTIGVGAVGVGAIGVGAVRHDLPDGAWVDVRPGWIRGSLDLFDALSADVPWRGERRRMYDTILEVPRLVARYDERAALPHPILAEARSTLCDHYRAELPEGFATAGLCLYRDGADSVAWHGDRIGRGRTDDTLIAILSLGSPRSLLLRPRGGGPSRRFVLGSGDLLVMGGSCQRTWDHCVPKTTGAGPRISVQFRPSGVM